MFIILFLILWTALSIWWFVKNLGNKHGGPDPWYIWVLGAPVLLIALVFGNIGHFVWLVKMIPWIWRNHNDIQRLRNCMDDPNSGKYMDIRRM